MKAKDIVRMLQRLADPTRARVCASFFKTGTGEYGEGDIFIGVTVPEIRKLARSFSELSEGDITALLKSAVHEERLCALLILVDQYERGDEKTRARVYAFYLNHADRINNWDLVDVSVYKILGAHLRSRSRKPLYKLARSRSLWERRMAIVATYAFIREKDLDDTFALAELLLGDSHDLIHKAVGWMLREAGKRDEARLVCFLSTHAPHMPRTLLRYAIERLAPDVRQRFLKSA